MTIALQMPEIRKRMLYFLDASDTRNQIRDRLTRETNFFKGHENEAEEVVIKSWREGELFYVNSEMSVLSKTAGSSLPVDHISRYDLPAPDGVIYFDSPFDEAFRPPDGVVVAACTWTTLDTTWGLSVFMSFYSDTLKSLNKYYKSQEPPSVPFEKTAEVMPLGYLLSSVEPLDDKSLVRTASDKWLDLTSEWTKVVRASWLLMQQEVAIAPVVEPTKRDVKLMKRRKIEKKPVRVVQLRRRKTSNRHSSNPNETSRYHHRWLVRGHWRRQWYPSQKRHIPIWITPHVKGPNDAPMISGEKVHSLSR